MTDQYAEGMRRAAEECAHEEQVRIWAHDIIEGLGFADVLKISSYDDNIAAHEVVETGVYRVCQSLTDAILAAIPASAPWTPPPAWADVQAERRRQIEAEGWTPEHDDQHERGEMATAAGCYIMHQSHLGSELAIIWPWDLMWWKPTDRRRDLVKAAALLLAEIERLDRLPPAPDAKP